VTISRGDIELWLEPDISGMLDKSGNNNHAGEYSPWGVPEIKYGTGLYGNSLNYHDGTGTATKKFLVGTGPTSLTNKTYFGIIRPEDFSISDYLCAFNVTLTDTTKRMGIFIYNHAAGPVFITTHCDATILPVYIQISGPISLNNFSIFSVGIDSDRNLILFINGTKYTNYSIGYSLNGIAGYYTIGNRIFNYPTNINVEAPYKGDISLLGMLNKAISEDEHTELYQLLKNYKACNALPGNITYHMIPESPMSIIDKTSRFRMDSYGSGLNILPNGSHDGKPTHDFDGTDAYEISDNTGLPVSDIGSHNSTITFWIKCENLPISGDSEYIIFRNHYSGGVSDGFYIDPSTSTSWIRFANATCNLDATFAEFKFDDGIPHMITVTLDHDRQLGYLYVDGIQYKSDTSFSETIKPTGESFVIGSGYSGDTPRYVGTIDGFKIYNKYMSASEISSLYMKEKNAKVPNCCQGDIIFRATPETTTLMRDIVGGNNFITTGDPTKDPTLHYTKMPNGNASYLFDGTNDYLRALNSSNVFAFNGVNRTLSVWYTHTADLAAYNTLLYNGYSVPGGWYLRGDNGGAYMRFYHQGAGAIVIDMDVATVNYKDGRPHLFSISINNAINRAFGYIDGIVCDNSAFSDLTDTSETYTLLGSFIGTQDWCYNHVGDIIIHNTALNATEIRELYLREKLIQRS